MLLIREASWKQNVYKKFQRGITLLIFGGLYPQINMRCSITSFSLMGCKLYELAGNEKFTDGRTEGHQGT